MQNLSNVCGWVQGIRLQMGPVCLIGTARSFTIWAAFMGVFSLQITLAQSQPIHWTDLDSFQVGYQVCAANDTLFAEEQFSVKLHLKTEGAQECIGALFDIEWEAGVSLDAAGQFTEPDQSWLGTSSEIVTSLEEDQTGDAALVEVVREDSISRSGNGWVVKVNFEVGNEPILVSEVVAALDGGLIVEENLDMRLAPVAEELDELPLVIYPNPFQGQLRIDNVPEGVLEVKVYDLSGNLVHGSSLGRLGELGRPIGKGTFRTLELSDLPPGVYFLTISQDGKLLKRVKVMRS